MLGPALSPTAQPPRQGTTNAVASDGTGFAYFQASNLNGPISMQQTISDLVVGQRCLVSFQTAGLEYPDGQTYGTDPFQVSIGDSAVTSGGTGKTVVTPSAAYEFYVSDVFTATSASEALKFFDAGTQTWSHVTLLDSVAVTAVPEPGTLVLLFTAVAAGVVCWFRRK